MPAGSPLIEIDHDPIPPGSAALRRRERRLAREPGYVFAMESSYHHCEVAEGEHAQRLDGYERELGFAPAWVGIDEALANNRGVLASGRPQTWVALETRVLAELGTLL